MKVRVGGILAILGGLMMVLSGFSAHSFSLSILTFLNEESALYLPDAIATVTGLVIRVLGVLIALGGITVTLGGVAILYQRLFTGRLLVALGGGASFLGILVALFFSVITTGFSSIILYAEYWTGVVLAMIGRRLAKRTK